MRERERDKEERWSKKRRKMIIVSITNGLFNRIYEEKLLKFYDKMNKNFRKAAEKLRQRNDLNEKMDEREILRWNCLI